MFFFFFLQLYARRHFLFPPLSIEDYNDRVRAVVRCEAQVCHLLTSFCLLKSVFEYGVMLLKKQCIVFALLHGFA